MSECRNALRDVTVSLAAAVSLLKASKSKQSAASDKMFDQMVADYEASLERARTILVGRAR